jgi:cytochrome b involved in lipid metabolism
VVRGRSAYRLPESVRTAPPSRSYVVEAARSRRADMAAEAKKFTREEVAASDGKTSHRFIIDNYVYDVSKFLDEHPGGHEVLVNVVGKDATEDFEDIGHSLDAKDLMKKFRIGELEARTKLSASLTLGSSRWSSGSSSPFSTPTYSASPPRHRFGAA